MHATKAFDGIKVTAPLNLISTLEGGEWSDLCPSHFTSGIRTSGPRCRYNVPEVIYSFVLEEFASLIILFYSVKFFLHKFNSALGR